MPSVVVKLYSVIFKALLKHKLLNSSSGSNSEAQYSSIPRAGSNGVPARASFGEDGVASKDINIDPHASLSLRIFLPDSALPDGQEKTGLLGFVNSKDSELELNSSQRRSSYAGESTAYSLPQLENYRRNSLGGEFLSRAHRDTHKYSIVGLSDEQGHQFVESFANDFSDSTSYTPFDPPVNTSQDPKRLKPDVCAYLGYLPDLSASSSKKLPIIVQFHGGGFVTGSKDSAANDTFCRRMAKLCDAIVIAVGYRLAPEHRYPAAFDDGFEVLNWLAKQANLAECSKSLQHVPSAFSRNGSDIHRPDLHRELVDSFGGPDVIEPWLAAHGDPTRCVLLGVSSGANIADFVARQAVHAGKLLDPVKVVAQALMYPFFLGSIPTRSEIKLANSYFFDKPTCLLAWKLFLPEGEFSLDHPAANPLIARKDLPLKSMPPTLTIVAELDWMKDRAIAYSEAMRRVNLDAPVLEYKDAVHEFATLDFLVKSRQAEACAEDMAIWIKKHISAKGHEFSY
ncbi:hypothetical protein KP509_32G064000 [Ceratopteris richardii]|uniref:Alpha/beta hydrolase fold-3 domain-containing protein n=1 Tax=Ceratopteris richardii TaxID=49495 RepID=A0A8T2QU08_CERRI|nr:hypothetical protein KP509_32G064000 [Ceratopteris richardii]